MIDKNWIAAHLFKDGQFKDRSLRHLTPEEKSGILALAPVENVNEAVYWVMNDVRSFPSCLACGKDVKRFTSYNQGYINKYCSKTCSNSSAEVKEKKKESSRERFGTDYPWQTKEVKARISQRRELSNMVKAPTIIEEVGAQGFEVLSWDHSKISNPAILRCSQNHTFDRQIEGWNRWNITCPMCSKTRSKAEVEIQEYIESLGFETDTTNRKILGGKEIDILVPAKNLAIEFNGMFWHSADTKTDKENRRRHIDKQDLAEERGLKMFQIWEDEWTYQKPIVKSRILQALGQSKKVYARQCDIKSLPADVTKDFLISNHIQGSCISTIRYGLRCDGVLVAVMTFGKPRFSKKAEWELLRYCTKAGVTVVGGPSKLFKHFLSFDNPSSILSYADRRWSQGDLYRVLGMTDISDPTPGYWYWKQGEGLRHRMAFQKHKLEKQLRYFDAEKTEAENMALNGYRVVWDCGQLQFIWRKDDNADV